MRVPTASTPVAVSEIAGRIRKPSQVIQIPIASEIAGTAGKPKLTAGNRRHSGRRRNRNKEPTAIAAKKFNVKPM
jgi:hypothetical protein